MSEALRKKIYALYEAYAAGRLDDILASCDDNIEFFAYAPVEVFPFLGHHRSKAEFAETIKEGRRRFEYLTYQPVFSVVEGNDAAVMVLARLRQRATNRIIQLFLAHFLRFQNGRLVEIREFMDSFDAVQQAIGHEIDLTKP